MKSYHPPVPPIRLAGRKFMGWVALSLLVAVAAASGALAGLLLVYSTDLPQVQQLEEFRPSSVTYLYDDQGRPIGSFALQRRVIASYDDFPPVLRQAIISTEDKDFERHWGINLWRALGAAYRDLTSGRRAEGASTLTMQLARNLFLSADRTWSRKLQEIILSIQIERRFTKPQIFTLYANQIYLGHGVYGFEAGAEYYFNKKACDLTLEEAAMLAALPKAPNSYSPVLNPERALRRRNLVINSMLEDGKITVAQAAAARTTPIRLHLKPATDSIAPYFVEEIRQYLERKYGSDRVHESGLRVYTSLNLEMQQAANRALLDGLAAYEHRHGWKGHLKNVLALGGTLDDYDHPDWDLPIEPGTYLHALVTRVDSGAATLRFGSYLATLTPDDMAWTGRRSPADLLARGDLAYVRVVSLQPQVRVALEQESGVQGALLAIDNATGDIKAMVGGRDFEQSKFNRATQAMRQVGSSFKPYVYAAAVEDNGLEPDDVVLDAPTVFRSGGQDYAPHNYDGRFDGLISIRRAFAQSRNIPAVKVAASVGMDKIIAITRRFGIASPILPYLPVALGAADMTLMEQTSAYTTFPDDGVRVTPRYIRKVTDYEGHVLEENYSEVADVVSMPTARTLVALMHEVTTHGTAARASQLGYPVAGKTGTTNDFTDAWFIGYAPSITCGVWVGFDEKKTLGPRETGSRAALPIWMDFMKVALEGRPEENFLPPPAAPPSLLRAASHPLDTPDHASGDARTH